MAKIFNPPKEIKLPENGLCSNLTTEESNKLDEKYLEELKTYLQLKNPNGKNVGEIIEFQIADGYAKYMVANIKPLHLVHIPLDDAYEFQYVHLLTTKEVNEQIESKKRFNKIFSK